MYAAMCERMDYTHVFSSLALVAILFIINFPFCSSSVILRLHSTCVSFLLYFFLSKFCSCYISSSFHNFISKFYACLFIIVIDEKVLWSGSRLTCGAEEVIVPFNFNTQSHCAGRPNFEDEEEKTVVNLVVSNVMVLLFVVL